MASRLIDFSKFGSNTAEITSMDIYQSIRHFGLPASLPSDMPEGSSHGEELPHNLVRILARISDEMVYMGIHFIRMTVHDVADKCVNERLSEEERSIWQSYFYMFLRRDIEKNVAIINKAGRFISDAKTHHAAMSLIAMCLKFGDMMYYLTPAPVCNSMMEYMRQLPMWLLEHVSGAQDLLEDVGGEISSSVADFLEKSARVIGTR